MNTELVKDWMTKDVKTIGKGTTLPEAHRMMTDHQIRRLPVVSENGRLIGIVTRGDIRGAEPSSATTLSIWELNYLLGQLTIGKIMTEYPLTVKESDTIGTAARTMMERRISGLPVVDAKGKLIGIITESDIFRLLVEGKTA